MEQIIKHTCYLAGSNDGVRWDTKTHAGDDLTIYVSKDIPNIAKAKNECLHALRDCDHIFLFDDDCFPIKDGWVEFFINSSKNGLVDHLLYLTDRHNKQLESFEHGGYLDCGGCFMYMKKSAINRVGYFNTKYKQYGFEHAGYSKRIYKKANILFLSLLKTPEYLYSLDYQGEGEWGIKHRPSITDYKTMQESLEYNRKVFQEEISGDKIYYEYEP